MQEQRTHVGGSELSLGTVLIVLSVVTVSVIVWAAFAWAVFSGPPTEGIPDASFTWEPEAPNVGDTVTFNASATTHPENATGYAWDFDGDGETDATGLVATHTFTEGGATSVRLMVSGVHGSTDVATRTVTVNGAPLVDAGSDKTIVEGSNLTWTLEITDPESAEWQVVVDYGDGTTDSTTTTESTVPFAHHYTTAGEYNATVTVTDDAGVSASDSFVVRIENTPPKVTASAVVDTEGVPATVSATFTDNAGETHTARVDWGDGTKENVTVRQTRGGGTVEATHIYEDDGRYNIVVYVTDDSGERNWSVLPVRVANRAPSIYALSADTPVAAGRSTHLSGAFADLGTNDSHTAEVDWGDGTVTTVDVWQTRNTVNAYHAYTRPGTYTATLTVTDDEGASARRSVRITVRVR